MITFSELGRLGRFGNQMHQIAGTIGVANLNNQEFKFPGWVNYDHAGRSPEDVDIQKYFLYPLPELDTTQYEKLPYQWGYRRIWLEKGNWSISGHFQSWKYWVHCEDVVRKYLTMKDEYEKNDRVAIHVRLGDYDNYYHPRLGADYYGEAISLMGERDYLIFTDEPDTVRQWFPDIPVYGGDYIDSFKMMKSCKDFIIGNSSYSLMAAYLGKGKVIAPKKWFGDHYQLETKDIYKKDWIVI